MTRHGAEARMLRCVSLLSLVLVLFLLPGARARAQEEVVPGMEDACIENFGYLGCDAMGMPKPPAQQLIVLHWAAVAISPTSLKAGGSHGQNSENEASQTALANCRRQGALDCKELQWARNECVSLAISYPDKTYATAAWEDRSGAANNALASCRSRGGKSCVVITAPCAADDPRWSSPLPLPPVHATGTVDPNMVGTWELSINPGRWVWRVAANGTYEFHSEAMDNAPSNAGTFTASAGHYTLHAITMPWDDAGTYKVQSPGVVIATGKLGTGTWRRIATAGPSREQSAPVVPRPASSPITTRK